MRVFVDDALLVAADAMADAIRRLFCSDSLRTCTEAMQRIEEAADAYDRATKKEGRTQHVFEVLVQRTVTGDSGRN